MLVFSSGTTHFQSFTNISNLRMITNINCAVMGILGPGIYLGTVEPWPVTWRFQKRVYFSEPVPKCIMAVFECSLQTQNVVRDKL